ncbi:hypothetical protein QBC34DRAFT_392352 [Podospora aff. communis PSN243]|uniref:Suppressor of anucleate metulae protein B n=1 Tax=Podospora aff. communis PSN243 TaxID=3040156 RepID=A0AAV9H3X7_9PEZI|nr:hypothetical protein QBC34DRAFT_392352 [Podospora aff. communis PSN243]
MNHSNCNYRDVFDSLTSHLIPLILCFFTFSSATLLRTCWKISSDNPTSLGMAPPGTRLTTSERGRALTATRPFAPGDLIATFFNPILALPDGPSMRTTCNYCLRTKASLDRPLRTCSACKAAVYCDPVCQRAHWKAVHKTECAMFTRVRTNVGKDWLPTPTRAVAQVLLLLQARDGAAEAAFGKVGTLEGNVQGFREDEKVWADFELQAMAAVVYGGLLESEEMLSTAREILCKIQTNAFNRLDADTGMAGIFLDAELSMINHSCVPNAFIGFDKRTAMLRAERDIAVGDEIEISYIDNTLPKPAREEGLRLYHFECRCARCADDLDVYQIASKSPVIRLNKFSLQPDLGRFTSPPINAAGVSSTVMETAYKAWRAGGASGSDATVTQRQWKLCKALAEARMWAIEPIPSTILQAVSLCQADTKTWAYALPLSCFLSTECDPFKLVAPFTPWRVKGMMMLAKLLGETARLTATGDLAKTCPDRALLGILERSDQMCMCEGVLRLVVHWATIGASQDWDILKEAKEMLQELETLEGREKESALLRIWATNPDDPEANAFFQHAVLNPVNELAALAIGIMDGQLWSPNSSAIVKR